MLSAAVGDNVRDSAAPAAAADRHNVIGVILTLERAALGADISITQHLLWQDLSSFGGSM